MTQRIPVSGFKKPAIEKAQPHTARVPFVRLRHTLWVWTLVGIAAAFMVFGTPHLRMVYTYYGSHDAPVYDTCTYWGFDNTQTIQAGSDGCPLIRFLKPPVRRDGSEV